MNRKKLILSVLLCLLAVALVVSYFRYPRQKSVEKLKYEKGAKVQIGSRGSETRMLLPQQNNLRLDLLDRAVPEITVSRDILKPVFVDEAKQAAMKAAAVKKPPPPPPPTPPDIARQQAGSLKPLGMLRKSGIQTAFFSRGNEIILLRVGDTPAAVPGYTVAGINDNALYLRSFTGDDEFSVPLR